MPRDRTQDNQNQGSNEDDDLKILNDMDIDKDFDVWLDFHGSLSQAQREEIGRLSLSRSEPLEVLEDGSKPEEQMFGDKSRRSLCTKGSLDVKFSPLSTAERRNIRSWAVRLERTEVFSRYYFPETWELREKEALQNEFSMTETLACSRKTTLCDVTRTTIDSIFFPADHDPKSVLLKRGPTLCEGEEQRELLLFTRGFMIACVEFDNLVNLLFDMNSIKSGTEENIEEIITQRFDTIDSDNTGELDRCELKELFQSMGVPISEQMLCELMARFDIDNNGTISFQEFKQVLNEMSPQEPQRKSIFQSLRKTITRGFSGSDIQRKLEYAFPLSDIVRVESLQICHSSKTKVFAASNYAKLSFAIFIRFRKDPLIMVCSKPEQRDAWVDAFKVCLINIEKLGSGSPLGVVKKPGWQHQLICETVFSLVILDDREGLDEFFLEGPRSFGIDVNDPDEYYGCSALHFAVIWDRLQCAEMLLAHGANINVKDDDNKTPLDHALNENMIQLLEGHGGKRNTDMEGMLKAQEFKSSDIKQNAKNTATQQVKKATGAMAGLMSAMKERGERLEKLDNTASSLQNETANYASMAKQMKEKAKKKSLFGL